MNRSARWRSVTRRRSARALLVILSALSGAAIAACASLDGLAGGGGGPLSDDARTGDGAAPSDAPSPGIDHATCAADLQSDSKNCGRCGHDCQGAPCMMGACTVLTLASGLGSPNGLALAGDTVYFTQALLPSLSSIPKVGGAVTRLVSRAMPQRGVAVSGTSLLWGDEDQVYDDAGSTGGIWSCALPACSAPTILVAVGSANEPVVHGGFLYFSGRTTALEPDLLRAPLSGGAFTLIGTTADYTLTIDDGYAYYSSLGTLFRSPTDGGSPSGEALVPTQGGTGTFIALDDARIYWGYADSAGVGTMLSLAKSAPTIGSIAYGSASDNVHPIGVAVDDRYLYWATEGTGGSTPNGDGKVLACPKAGCDPSGPLVLASGNFGAGPIALDDSAVYWLEAGHFTTPTGRLRKVAKP